HKNRFAQRGAVTRSRGGRDLAMTRDFKGVGLKAASLASASLLSLTAGAALAQERPQPEAAEAARVDDIIVTGVRGAPRTAIESPTPIDVFNAEQLQQGAQTGVFESVRYLVPSFNLPARSGGGSSTVIATGALRGLNPDQTLVLVNGKRRHRTALINSVSTLYNGS